MDVSPDGRALAILSEMHGESHIAPSWLDVYDARTLRRTWSIENPGCYGTVVFSPDGQTLAMAVAQDGTITLYSASTGRKLRTLNSPNVRYGSLLFLPDGKSLARLWTGNIVALCDLETGAVREIQVEPGHWMRRDSVAVNAAGLLAVCGQASVHLWDTRTWEWKATLPTAMDEPTVVQFSPDGRLLRCAGRNTRRATDRPDTWFVTQVFDVTTRASQCDVPCAGESVFSPDGKSLICGVGKELTIRDVATGHMVSNVEVTQNWIRAMAVSANEGLLILVGQLPDSTRSTVEVVDARPLLAVRRGEAATSRPSPP
jgi:WD40 repeat protein